MLSLPFLVFLVGFDIMKAPIVLCVLFPLWGLMDLIAILRGKDSYIFGMMITVLFMGISMWMDMVDIKQPAWMDQ